MEETVVVWGPVDLRDATSAQVTWVENRDWASGQASSLALALSWCDERDYEAVVVGVADAPLIPASAWEAVGHHPANLAIASFRGVLHPPVRLHRSLWPALPHSGDQGARDLWKGGAAVAVDCEGFPGDVDTVEDLKRLGGR